ncbi:MAG TPA: sugar phosphate nucleotidyltransferase, partial [Chloroflexia bacterium]|nr:sugar phosphate nucleotidyltransferase [Chloroflexia bacterium]
MKAVIMAGGEGSRLRPLTIRRPKPMVPVVDRPAIVHIIELLKKYGITEVVITLQYLASVIQEYLGDGSQYGIKIHYTVEDSPLGTAGSVRLGIEWLNETFMVISGDALTDFDLGAAMRYHKQKKSMATLVLKRMPNPLEYGVVITAEDGRVRQFQEKPSWGEVFSDTVNTGIYILEPKLFDYYEAGQVFDFSNNLFPILLEKNDPMYGYIADGYWCDVGSIPDYMTASSDYLSGQVSVPRLGKETEEGSGIWAEEEVEIAKDASITGPVFLGRGVRVKSGAIIRGPSVIREFTTIDTRATVDRAVIWRNCYVGERAEVRGAILQTQVNVKTQAMIFEGAVIGDGTIIGNGAVIHPNVKIWPDKEVESGATVTTSIIWGAQGRRSLFGRWGVTGLVNVDLTPEFAAKLGAAYGGMLTKGTTVTVNRDSHYTPRMIKRAIIAGLPSAGINVLDLRNVPIPVARHYTRVIGAAGGVHVRLSPFDARVVDVKFFDKRGLDLDKATERKVEGLFFREDFRRVYLEDVGRIDYANDVEQLYSNDYLSQLNVEAIQNGDDYSRIAVDYAHSSPSFILPALLGKLNADVVAINAVVQEQQLYQTPEQFEKALERLGAITKTLKAGFGVRLDTGGERIYFVDEQGEQVTGMTALAVMCDLALAHANDAAKSDAQSEPSNDGNSENGKSKPHNPRSIVVPVYAPSIFEEIAKKHGAEIIRTRFNSYALMSAALKPGVVVAGDGQGSFIFPQFQPTADGLFAIAKLMEMTAIAKTRFTRAIENLPRYAMASTRVPCRWEDKGRVMRILNEQYRDNSAKQVDGVKINLGNGEWAL